MSPRKIFDDPAKQRLHEDNCKLLRRGLFKLGRKMIERELQSHPGSKIHRAILDLRLKREMLVVDLGELKKACDEFWKTGMRLGSDHEQYCLLQRTVWRHAFHVAQVAESLKESIFASAGCFSRRRKANGKKHIIYAISEFESRWSNFEDSPLVQFNTALRAQLFHSQLLNPEWTGHINFEEGIKRERFMLKQTLLNTLEGRSREKNIQIKQYIEQYSVGPNGSRKHSRAEILGVDLLDHYDRYTTAIKEMAAWIIQKLSDPQFGSIHGLEGHMLDEFLDWKLAIKPPKATEALCEFCGQPVC